MCGTLALPALDTGGLVSGQPCNVGAHRRNVFDELFDLALINKLPTAAVGTSTELDLKMLALQRSQRLATWASFAVAAVVGVATVVNILVAIFK